MRITASNTPADVYTLATIASGSIVDVQNQSPHGLRIYAGASAPASKKDYFNQPPGKIERYQGAVIMIWAGQPINVVVQEIA